MAGNRTPVIRVTGGDTSHYTTTELFFMEFLLYFKDIHPRTKIIVKILFPLSFLYSLQMTIDNTIADQLEEASFSFKGDVIQFFKNMIVCSFFAPLSVSTPDIRWILIDIIV